MAYQSKSDMTTKSKKTKKIIWTVVIIALLLILGSFAYQIFIAKPEIKNPSWNDPVNEGNICEFLSGTNLVEGLSKNSVVSFKTYDFNTGYRNIKKSCIMTKGKAVSGQATKYDLEVQLHEKYVSGLGKNVCETIQNSRKTNDLDFELNTGVIKLFFKYIKTLKYGDCAGFI